MRVMEINPSSPRKALEGCFLSKTRLTIRSFFGRLSEGCWGGAGVGWGGVGWGGVGSRQETSEQTRHILTKSSLRRKASLAYASDHSPPLEEAEAGTEAATLEEPCLLAC
jgi:hypothetical protein